MDGFFTALRTSGVWFNGLAAPAGAERIKLRDYGDLPTVTALATVHGLRYTIRDGMVNGPAVTLRPRKAA
jgi:hypothetical protein